MKRSHSLFITYNGALEPLIQSQGIPYLKGLRDRGVKISLLSFEKREYRRQKQETARLEKELSGCGINWYRLPYLAASPGAAMVSIVWGIFYSSYLVLTKRIDIIHARSYLPSIIGFVLKLILRVRLIFDMRGFLADEYADANIISENGIIFKLMKMIEKRLILSADEVIVLTEKAAEIIRDLPYIKGKKVSITVIPCCADLNKFKLIPAKRRRELLREYELEDRFILIHAGSVGPWYKLGEMIDFFSALKQRLPRAHFLLLSNSNHDQIFEAIASRRLNREDFTIMKVSLDTVADFISIAHSGVCLIKPTFSKKASSPTKVAECLACGRPIVINSGIGDSEQFIKGNRTGVVLNSFDQKAYDRAIDELLKLIGEGDKLLRRCQETARNSFSLDYGVGKYWEVYSRLLRSL